MAKKVSGDARINWVDMARGYGIILVIIGHIESFGTQWDHVLRSEIYSFHMPLFFMISGFLFSAMKYTPKEFLAKRLKGIMLPYLLIGLAIIAVNWLFYDMGDFEALIFYFKELAVQNRFHVIWYLSCLFVSEIVFYAIVRLLKDCWWQTAIICTMLAALGLTYYYTGGQSLPWNVDVCPMAIFFIFLGYSVKKIKLKQDIKYFVIAIIINVVCVALNEIILGRNLEMFNRSYAIVPFSLAAALAGVYVVYWLSVKWQFAPIEYIGKYSLVYFGLHQAFTLEGWKMLCGMMGWFPNRENPVQGIIYIILDTLISVGVLTLVNILVQWIKTRIKTSKK